MKSCEDSASNLHWHTGAVTAEERTRFLGHGGCTVWLSGLSGSGKSTLACALEQTLLQRGCQAYRLDGDNIRLGLNRDLGFSAADRTENIRRIGEVSKLFADSGCICLTAFISPYRRDRDAVRALHEAANLRFYEVYVACPLEVAEQRDPKGLYKKARAGQIKCFTGIDDPYEEPEHPELRLDTDCRCVEACVQQVLQMLQRDGVVPPRCSRATANGSVDGTAVVAADEVPTAVVLN